jgi:integrase/recombinase XerD
LYLNLYLAEYISINMATIKVLLKKNKGNKETGNFPLYVRVHNGKTEWTSLGIEVPEHLWDASKEQVKSKFPNSARINHMIIKRKSEIQAKIIEFEDDPSANRRSVKKALAKKVSPSFIDYFEEYVQLLEQEKKVGTLRKVKSLLRKFKEFIKVTDLSFAEFDLELLKKYDAYLKGLGNKQNTIHANLKVFRKLFNDAVREDVIEIQHDPFQKFKIKKESVEKIFLTEDELTAFEAVSVSSPTVKVHQDMFVFACYAGGIRISDLLKLRWENFDGTHIHIFIQKTKNHLSINLPNRAREIIAKYKPSGKPVGYIFPVLKNDDDHSDPQILLKKVTSATAYANKSLKSLAKSAKITKTVTFHSSRHTFATRALAKKMPVTHVSKIMGHSNLQVTMGYAKIVNKDLDEAMNLLN